MSDVYIRNDREQKLVQYASELAQQIDKTASKYDESGEFPFEQFKILEDAGYFKLTVPKKYGGEEISLYEMLLVQEQLAKGDGSTALSVGWHLLTFLNVREAKTWPEPIFAELSRKAVKEGSLLNIINSERGKGNISRGSLPGTITKKVPGGYIITGEKAFASLAPILKQFTIIAYIEEENLTAEFLVTKNDQVEVVNTWDAMGMRATGSHDIIFHDTFVPEEALLYKHRPNEINRFLADGRVYSLEIPAVYLGVAGAARDYAIDFAKNTYSYSLENTIAHASHVQQKIGEIEILYQTARRTLYSIAAQVEQNPAIKDQLSEDVSIAKYVICNNAIDIVTKAMQVVGGRSLSKTSKLQRLFRDVQCSRFNPPADDVVITQLAKGLLVDVKQGAFQL
ncbi:acyl-CoA dehydrogenase [Lysinibacillus sphaericus]|uniref:acyl-CoA dehydrogenase family protein n=1 Tax=Lysinibacillus sphaericus TaxID=1421 RepID=UPI0018CDD946|nr:acyl-CoA dehydrogenase family protein [Lysinibacillus sphaericus]MBG9452717.1 acyl-CoA dehydrogenase [Lysinibacillus sphaericus]MBG9479815.1 acyl-CoA dehydrogenase [Lysinibacillus sphaericus]MBG9595266.1 acyl-CoA dehydrogenase [Lysinibacillus sphaericus]